MSVVEFKRPSASVTFGDGRPTGVAALIGVNRPKGYKNQIAKLDALTAMESPPDIVSDLSIVELPGHLITEIVSRGFYASGLPVYLSSRNGRISSAHLLENCLEQIELGASMLTIHPTASHERNSLAARRLTPVTSRGGGMVARDLTLRPPGAVNAYVEILPALVEAATERRVVLSLGATYRSANVLDSLDAVQRSEIDEQIRLAREIAAEGGQCIIESPGHARFRDIQRVAELLAPSGVPVMPLGPIPTESAVGFDHVSSAIGATLLGLHGAAHILSAVTREEHTGGVPTIASTVEAVRATRVAAAVIDEHRLGLSQENYLDVVDRARNRSCVPDKRGRGCSRCGPLCPL